MLVFRQHHEIGRRHEFFLERRELLKGVRNVGRISGKTLTRFELILFEPIVFELGGMEKRGFDLFGHQSVGANLGELKGVGFVEADIENSSEGSILINRHDEKCVGAELAANVGFDSGVGLSIFDPKDFAVGFGAGGIGQAGGYLAANQGLAGSAARAVRQAISLEQGDGNTAGLGNVARRLHDVSHDGVDVNFAAGKQPLNFHNGGEGVRMNVAFLHRKCIGQKLLESFAVVGWVAHTAVTLCLATLAGERTEPP